MKCCSVTAQPYLQLQFFSRPPLFNENVAPQLHIRIYSIDCSTDYKKSNGAAIAVFQSLTPRFSSCLPEPDSDLL
jgi:hypothetical protein